MHKVDIVVPTYNYGRFLDECLRSVLAQTWGDFQVLVVDNASEDHTEELMREWVSRDERIRYVRNPVNIGAFGSLRKAQGMTSAPYWMTLSADDFLLPEFLEKIVANGLERHEASGFGYCLTQRLTQQGLVPDMYQFIPDLETGVHNILYHLCMTNWILMSFGVCRRRCLDEVRMYERYERRFYAGAPRRGSLGDHYQWLLLASRYPAFVVNERLATYRVHDSNDTSTMGRMSFMEENAILYDTVFFDQDAFPLEARYIARINQIGRLFTSNGIASTAISMARSAETGPHIQDRLKPILETLSNVLRQFRFDDSSGRLSHLKFESDQNLDALANIASQLAPPARSDGIPA